MIIERVFEGMTLGFASVGFLASLTILVLICMRIRPLASNVPILLIYNTYITMIGFSFSAFLVMSYGMYANLHPSVSFDDYSCQLRSYINHIFTCAFYYSCVVQATFRLFRVVFPKHKILQSRGVMIVAVVVQWLAAVLFMLAYLLLGYFQYQPAIGSCWISFTNTRGIIIGTVFLYSIPLAMMGGIYASIIRYIHRSVQTQQIRQQANKRDLLVVKRMLILVSVAIGIGLPSLCICIIYFITNYLSPLAYHIEILSETAGFATNSIVFGLISPQVREMFRRNRQILPVIATVQNVAPRRVERVDNVT